MVKSTPEDDEWYEVSARDWLPRFKTKQLKLLADAQVSDSIVTEIRNAGNRRAMSAGEKRSPDQTVLQLGQREGRVLLTLDGDFWDDRKYPLQSIEQGIIFVEEPPREHDRVLRAFGLVYGCFAKNYPLDWWNHMKVRAVLGEFEIKMRTWEGKARKYRLKLRRGYLVVKDL